MTYNNGEWATTQVMISKATASSTALVAAVTSKKILVCQLVLVAAGTVVATLEDDDGNDLSGPMTLSAGVPLPLPMNAIDGHLTTSTGKGLNLLLGGAVQVSGWLRYRVVA